MNQPRFHAKARAEFEKSALFYDGRFPGLGLEFAVEVQAAVAFAFSHPEAGAPVADGFRRVIVRRFPYSVVYRAKGEHIYIIAVAHQRRHPNYWSDRV
ncbi:MAG: type II toxin-antitoxin system RelE/ParE family toxin [Gammaproteobacteria bacterium]|nr:type II toxin-antitoxin system RelE/ParE family toxin [Gammaproteobacteria bacterium]MBU1969765.1 type II toxin-antitoxin system RelE/ParE family toxin [Gammaproteobacteria bacterium]